MEQGIPGTVKEFPNRVGGYINYNYRPDGQPADNMLNQQSADNMLSDFNDILNNYFPWMKDFVIFQFTDGTIRLDIADRQFLGGC